MGHGAGHADPSSLQRGAIPCPDDALALPLHSPSPGNRGSCVVPIVPPFQDVTELDSRRVSPFQSGFCRPELCTESSSGSFTASWLLSPLQPRRAVAAMLSPLGACPHVCLIRFGGSRCATCSVLSPPHWGHPSWLSGLHTPRPAPGSPPSGCVALSLSFLLTICPSHLLLALFPSVTSGPLHCLWAPGILFINVAPLSSSLRIPSHALWRWLPGCLETTALLGFPSFPRFLFSSIVFDF